MAGSHIKMTIKEQLLEIVEAQVVDMHECTKCMDQEGGIADLFHSLQRAKLLGDSLEGIINALHYLENDD